MDDVIPLSQVPAQCRAVNTRVASHKSSDSDNSGSCKDTWLGHTPGELSKLQREDIESSSTGRKLKFPVQKR